MLPWPKTTNTDTAHKPAPNANTWNGPLTQNQPVQQHGRQIKITVIRHHFVLGKENYIRVKLNALREGDCMHAPNDMYR